MSLEFIWSACQAYLVIRPTQLLHRKRPHPRIHSPWPQELQGIIRVDLRPLRQQLLHRLLHLRRVPPCHTLQKLGQTLLIPRQIEAELPDEVFLLRGELLRGRVVEDLRELVAYLGVGFEFAIVRAATVRADEAAVFVFDRVLIGDIGVDDAP